MAFFVSMVAVFSGAAVIKSEFVPIRTDIPYNTASWTELDGLPFDEVRSIVQRRDGFVWVATRNGLARFDGIQFESFNTGNMPQLPNNDTCALLEDSRGRLWVGHDTGNVSIIVDQNVESFACPLEWGPYSVEDFKEDEDGTVWAINAMGTRLPFRGGVAGVPVPGRREPLRVSSPSSLDGKWQRSKGRLIKRDRGIVVETLPYPSQSGAPIALLETRAGQTFVATAKGGVFAWGSDRRRFHFDSSTGFMHKEVLCLYEGRNGIVWAGAKSGLVTIQPRRFTETSTPVPVRRGLESYVSGRSLIRAWAAGHLQVAVPRAAGGIWLGTTDEGLYGIARDVVTRPVDTPSSPIHTLAEMPDGSLWMNGLGETLVHLDKLGVSSVVAPDSVNTLHCDRRGTLWLGGQNGLWKKGAERWERALPPDVNIQDVLCIANDGDSVWIGTATDGLGRLCNGQFSRYTSKDGLPIGYIRSLLSDPERGHLWIGTSGGLVLFRDGRFDVIGGQQGIPGSQVLLVLDDGMNRLWLRTNHGLAVIARDELIACADGNIPRVSPLEFDISDGFEPIRSTIGTPVGCRSAEGLLYFVTRKGVARFNPAKTHSRKEPMPIIISRVVADEKVLIPKATESLVLPPGVSRFRIDFCALDYFAPHRVRYSSRLQGLSDKWTVPSTERHVEYTRLLPGRYCLELRACNGDGVWNDKPLLFDFTVLPFFWQTWWFKGLVSLGSILLASFLTASVVERINRRRRIAAERQQAIERERIRIARDIHDEIGAGLTQVSLISSLISNDRSTQGELPTQHVSELTQITADLAQRLDEIIWVTTPRNDTLDSLCAYLEQYTDHFLHAADIRNLFDIPSDLPDWPLAGDVRHNLYLVVKEALNNIVKHAGATCVEFGVSTTNDTLYLSIADDGKGIASAPAGRFGEGLESMHERMRSMGGSLRIDPNPSGGLVVILALKVRSPK